MKWFKHDTDTSSDPKIKLLKKEFGIEGVGVYFEIDRLIAKNVEENIDEWGYLAKEYTDFPDLLAEEIGIKDVQTLHSICTYCVRVGLLYQTSTRILNPKILLRADRYTEQKAKENKLKIDEYVQKLYRLCTEYTPRIEENRIEENRILVSNESKPKEKTSVPWKRPNPEKQSLVQRLVFHLEDTLNTKITTWGKQGEAVKLMTSAGYTEDNIKKAITFMATKDEFYRDKGFDLMTVCNHIPRLKAKAEAGRRNYETTQRKIN